MYVERRGAWLRRKLRAPRVLDLLCFVVWDGMEMWAASVKSCVEERQTVERRDTVTRPLRLTALERERGPSEPVEARVRRAE